MEISSVNKDNLSSDFVEKYEYLLSKSNNINLIINDIYSTLTGLVDNITKNTVSLYETEIAERFAYIGFGYKEEIFSPVFMWNMIPLTVLSILIMISLFCVLDEYKGIKRILYPFFWSAGLQCIFSCYSAFLAFVFSCLSNRILFSASFTIAFSVVSSLIVTICIIVKFIKYIES